LQTSELTKSQSHLTFDNPRSISTIFVIKTIVTKAKKAINRLCIW